MSIPARVAVRSSNPTVSSQVPWPPTLASNFFRWTTNITISITTMASTRVALVPIQGRRMCWRIPIYLTGHCRTINLTTPQEDHQRRPPTRSRTFATLSYVKYAAARSPHLTPRVVCAATSRQCRFHLRAPGTIPSNRGPIVLQIQSSSKCELLYV